MRDPRKIRFADKRRIFPNWSVTNWVILVNIIFFAIGFLIINHSEKSLYYLALQPISFLHGFYWTLISSMFMHANIFHLFVNMFVLFSLGNLCERIIGRKRFLWFYLLSGILAGLAFVFFAYFFGQIPLGAKIFGSPKDAAVGASGAIFAVAGLFMVLTPKLKFMIIFLPFFSLPAYVMIPLVLFVTWIISFSAGIGVGNTAHLGGFLAGLFYGLYLRNKYKRKTKMISEYFQ